MRRSIGPLRALANLLACLALVGAAVAAGYQVAGRRWLVQETFEVRAEFQTIGGVEPGGRVFIQGIDAGTVEAIVPPSKPGEPVELVLRLDANLRPLVRSDAVARIAAQGLVGAKVVEIDPGSASAPTLPAGAPIRTEVPVELADLMDRARQSLDRVDAAVVTAENGLAEISAIAGSIRGGEGTLGRLVNDEEAYERLVRLTDSGEKALGKLNENLQAVQHTWPISSYFNRRAYFDRERALFRPGASRQSRALAARELFEPGRSVLTIPGRQALDNLAAWLAPKLGRDSEIVVAAFGDESGDLAEVLTQEQAEAVRRYLTEEHGLGSAGWFRSRKVAAIGYGTTSPQLAPASDLNLASLPARRVEIIVFTPRA